MNLLEQQAANRRRTVLVMAAFIAFLLFLGLGFDYAYFSSGAAAIPMPVGTTVALLYGGGSAAHSYFRGDRAVLASTAATSVSEAIANAKSPDSQVQLRQFQNVVEEMAIAAGLPLPKAYVVPDPDPNAFATGRNPERASIAVTEGLLRVLNREELQGVVAHEMAHIRNYDIRLMTVVAALVGAIALLSDWAGRGFRYGGMRSSGRSASRDKKGDGNILAVVLFVIWVVAIILAPIIARMLATLVSRKREYLADATGAELTRNPLALAAALAKIEDQSAATKSIKQGSAHLCIADPLERRVNEKEGRWADLFATHPPMHKRIAALRGMAYQSGDLVSS